VDWKVPSTPSRGGIPELATGQEEKNFIKILDKSFHRVTLLI
jgi:hypothetical protein